MPYGTRPPEPDEVAQRGTDQWRDAVHAKQQWIAMNLARGVSIDDPELGIEKYGEGGSSREGRLSHDYEKWQKAQRGEAMGDEGLPSELGDAQWDIGNFRRQTKNGDFTEWPPGSGQFFNDPANDQNSRQWFNGYGDSIPPPADGGPDIDYEDLGRSGMTPAEWVSENARHIANAKKAKPYTTPVGPNQPQQPTADVATPRGPIPPASADTAPNTRVDTAPTQRIQARGVASMPASTPITQEGSWGAAARPAGSPGGFGTARPQAAMGMQQPTQALSPGGFGSNQPAIQKRRGAFGAGGGY